MKKVLILAVTVVAVIALGNVLLVAAQGGTQPGQRNATCPTNGYTCPISGTMPSGTHASGMMGRGSMGGMMHGGAYTNTMPMHEYMMGQNGMHEQVWTAVAQELDMTYVQLTAALQNGQTIAQLAEAAGVPLADVKQAAFTAVENSLSDLVEQGVMTRQQADWMLEHMNDMPMFNFDQSTGPGMMGGRGMMHGGGMMPGHGSGGMMHGWQQPAGPQG